MNTEEFIDYISKSFDIKKSSAKAALKVITEGLYMAISENNKVQIDNLGSFFVSNKKARNIWSRTKNKMVKIPQHKQAYFKADKNIKIAANT
jgi:nucleoid DNA-binding protein